MRIYKIINRHLRTILGAVFVLTVISNIITGCAGASNEAGAGPRSVLQGVVSDSNNEQPIPRAMVSTDNGIDLVTALDGTYSFPIAGLENTSQLNACAVGYKNSCTVVNFDPAFDNVITINFALDRSCTVENSVDPDGDGIPCQIDWLTDSDADYIPDYRDLCPDFDDLIDTDKDNVPDCIDAFIDSDSDGVIDELDKCNQADDRIDLDSDGIADCNLASIDYDQDGLTKGQEDLLGTNPYQVDTDKDSINDFEELGYSLHLPIDTDKDGIINPLDEDSDNDGVHDSLEAGFDYDDDGISDHLDGNSVSGINKSLISVALLEAGSGQLSIDIVSSSDVCTCNNPAEIFSDDIIMAKIINVPLGAVSTISATVDATNTLDFDSIQVLGSNLRWLKRTSEIDEANQVQFTLVDGGLGDLDGIENNTITSLIVDSYRNGANSLPNLPSSECFIATAAYGTPFEPEVILLRQFRDEFLLTNQIGTYLTTIYYRVSPDIALLVESHSALRVVVLALLAPLVLALKQPVIFGAVSIFAVLAVATLQRALALKKTCK